MKGLSEALKQKANNIKGYLSNGALDVIEVEVLNSVEESFDNEGFTDSSLKKWKRRTTINKKGQNITRYRTNKVGRRGDLNSYGRKTKGRAILTGHDSGGNKLRVSYRASRFGGGVRFATDKVYAKRHNEGLDGMPQRKHIGASASTDKRVLKKMNTRIDKIMR